MARSSDRLSSTHDNKQKVTYSAPRSPAAGLSKPAARCWSASACALKADAQEKGHRTTRAHQINLSSDSCIEIHADNTILIRTGKSDFGQSTVFTAYRQIVAEELYVPFEAITTVISGDTDRTPDGGGTFDLLGQGMPNIRKAAAYVYQALLESPPSNSRAKDQLSVKDGIVSGGGKSISYGDLVKRSATQSDYSCEGRHP